MPTKPLFGSGASKIMRCFPLIFPNHASRAASSEASRGVFSAARRDGRTPLKPAAAATAAIPPRKPRRPVVEAVRSDMSSLLANGHEIVDEAKVALFPESERGI